MITRFLEILFLFPQQLIKIDILFGLNQKAGLMTKSIDAQMEVKVIILLNLKSNQVKTLVKTNPIVVTLAKHDGLISAAHHNIISLVFKPLKHT